MDRLSDAASPGVTTVALLARRAGMSVDLFSRYWRDVHGVLAVRIPGFATYTQYHVTPVSGLSSHGPDDLVIDGFAEVTFDRPEDREAMATSDVVPLILQDEPNVFSRTLLYALAPGASETYRERDTRLPDFDEPVASYLLVVQSSAETAADEIASALSSELLPPLLASIGLTALRRHLLASGDPAQWNTVAGVDNTERGLRNSAVIHVSWEDEASAAAALDTARSLRATHFPRLRVYRITARCAMVAGGCPTHLGLRGLDVWRTLHEAGAENQKTPEVVRKVYGPDVRAPA